MDILIILKALKDNFWKLDWMIAVAAIVNGIVYFKVTINANKLYYHFNPEDKTLTLSEKVLKRLMKNTKGEQKLSARDLLNSRERMNSTYAWYSNLTSMFPLFGMLGTVVALIPMVNTIGTTNTSNFFSALTSTAWGIVMAITFKMLDAFVSYKIEDNEKRLEHLLFKE